MVFQVDWATGRPQMNRKPKLWWERISPFDLYWTPGAADIEDAAIIERTRLTRNDLNDLLDVEGFDHNAIRAVLDNYGRGGLSLEWDMAEGPRAALESREDPWFNRSGMISCLQYTGNVQGRMLLDYGFTVGRHSRSDPRLCRRSLADRPVPDQGPARRQPAPPPQVLHHVSWEKVPGTPVGNALPDQITDLQEVCNASLRAIVNNLSIASGPQVVVNDDRLAGLESGEDMYPWKRWHVTDPLLANSNEKPIEFFQPPSNAQELMGVFKGFYDLSRRHLGDPAVSVGQFARAAVPGAPRAAWPC